MPYKSSVVDFDDRADREERDYYHRRKPESDTSVAIDPYNQPDRRRSPSPQTIAIRPRYSSSPRYIVARNVEPSARPGNRKLDAEATSRGHIQEVDRSKDLTVHLSLPITDDFDERLDIFSQLIRLGDFIKADQYFREQLEDHLSHPYVFVQYAAMLLKRGDYIGFDQLDAEPVFLNDNARRLTQQSWDGERDPASDDDGYTRGYHSDDHADDQWREARRRTARRRNSTKRTQADQSDALNLLHRDWKLMKALCTCYREGVLNDAVKEVENAMIEMEFSDEMCSTEMHIVLLTFQICSLLMSKRTIYYNFSKALENWFDGTALYESLLTQGRIWDFTDLYKVSCTIFGLHHTLALFARNQSVEAVMDQWTLESDDESTTLAQLDMLSWALTQPSDRPEGTEERQIIFEKAMGYAESIKIHHPKRMKSAPFISWLLSKTVYTSLKQKWFSDHIKALNSHLADFPGLEVGSGYWFESFFYVPRWSESPGRPVPNTPAGANQPIIVALKAAKQLGDYQAMAYGLDILIVRSKDPHKPTRELLDLQKTQGDERNYMFTLLMSYLTCPRPEDQRRLLKQLKQTPTWRYPKEIRSHNVYLARDFILRALTIRLEPPEGPLRLKADEMPYLEWLEPHFRDFAMRYADEPASDQWHHQLPGQDFDERWHDRPPQNARSMPTPASRSSPPAHPIDALPPLKSSYYQNELARRDAVDTSSHLRNDGGGVGKEERSSDNSHRVSSTEISRIEETPERERSRKIEKKANAALAAIKDVLKGQLKEVARRRAAELEVNQRIDRLEDLIRRRKEGIRHSDTEFDSEHSEPSSRNRRRRRARSSSSSGSDESTDHGHRSRMIAYRATEPDNGADDAPDPRESNAHTDLVLYDPTLPHVRDYNHGAGSQAGVNDGRILEEDSERKRSKEYGQQQEQRHTRASEGYIVIRSAHSGNHHVFKTSPNDGDWSREPRTKQQSRSDLEESNNSHSLDRVFERGPTRDEDREIRGRERYRDDRRHAKNTRHSRNKRSRAPEAFDEDGRADNEAIIQAEVEDRLRAEEERRRRQNQRIESRHSFSRDRRPRPEVVSEQNEKDANMRWPEPSTDSGIDMVELGQRNRHRRDENMQDLRGESTGVWDAFQEVSAKGKAVNR
ncbi:hypothetical protein Daus18300_011895 [Diaporthe australafricana]|uniref:Uncharacterized protein n=1 Tax=Diaporthe australafricana TaxID=127596 RepID=A0ABR3W4U9_9PEZI